MNRRFEITDEEWERLAPLLPATTPRRGGRWRDHRQVLNGISTVVRAHQHAAGARKGGWRRRQPGSRRSAARGVG